VLNTRLATGALLAFAALLGIAAPLQAQKTDTLTLRNGDEITGEIKELQRGKLSYSTDDMGTISVEWLQIRRLVSTHFFEIETGSGDRYFGAIQEGAEPGFMVVAVAEFSDTLRMQSVVRIIPIETTFWERLDGRVDLGFNYQKANRLLEYSLTGYVRHRAQRAITRFDYSFYFQTQEAADETSRNTVNGSYQRAVKGSWFYIGGLGLEQNTQLNLDLRVNVLGGAGLFFIRTNKGLLQSLAGLNYTNELKTGSTERTNNLEAVIGGEAAYFLFDSPKTDIDAYLSVFPNLTTFGRVRISFRARLSYELLSDFTVGFNIFDEFDSGDPDGGQSVNDFGTEFTIGYKW
jgi:hypothetical protein